MTCRPAKAAVRGLGGAARGVEAANPSRLTLGVVASFAMHALAMAAVVGTAAWRVAPATPAPEAVLQLLWQEGRPEPGVSDTPRTEPPPLPELAMPAAPTGLAWLDGIEPEDALLTAPPEPPAAAATFVDAVTPVPAVVEAPRPPPAVAWAAAPAADPTIAFAALAVPVPIFTDEPAPSPAASAPPVPPAATPPTPAPPSQPAAAATSRPAPPAAPRPPPSAATRRASSPPPRAVEAVAASPWRPTSEPAPGRGEPVALATPLPAAAAPLIPGLPRYRRPPTPPVYPTQARDRGEEGTVALRVLVASDGGIRDVRLHRSSGNRLFDDAALAAARRWEIEPATLNGVRVEAWVEAPVRFRLEQ